MQTYVAVENFLQEYGLTMDKFYANGNNGDFKCQGEYDSRIVKKLKDVLEFEIDGLGYIEGKAKLHHGIIEEVDGELKLEEVTTDFRIVLT
jgi:hypothetical protein